MDPSKPWGAHRIFLLALDLDEAKGWVGTAVVESANNVPAQNTDDAIKMYAGEMDRCVRGIAMGRSFICFDVHYKMYIAIKSSRAGVIEHRLVVALSLS